MVRVRFLGLGGLGLYKYGLPLVDVRQALGLNFVKEANRPQVYQAPSHGAKTTQRKTYHKDRTQDTT
jgi:hypothetical protein